jgi:hypothetical protein
VPRPIVHIGYHKTATTWFQKAFYPFVRNARFIPRERVRAAFLEVGAFHFDPAKALAELGTDGGERVALCEEGLSGYLHNGGLGGHLSRAVAERLASVFPDARIVIFIRSQPSIVAATYEQYVRGGGTHSLRRYAFAGNYLKGARSEFHRAPRFTFDHYEYGPLIAWYRELFGAANVHVYPFEAFRKDSRTFLEAFARELELEVDIEALSMRSTNRAYGLRVMDIVRLLNLLTSRTVIDKQYLAHIPFWYGLVRGIGEGLNALPWLGASAGARAVLGEDVHDWIRQRYWRSNRALIDATGLPLVAYGYPVDPPERDIAEPGPPSWLSWWGN